MSEKCSFMKNANADRILNILRVSLRVDAAQRYSFDGMLDACAVHI